MKNDKSKSKNKNKPETVSVVVHLYGGVLEDIRLYRDKEAARRYMRRVRAEMKRDNSLDPDCTSPFEAWDGDDIEYHLWEGVGVG